MSLIVKSTRERVVKLSIATVLCFGLAVWCWYDAFYKESMKESSRQFNLYAVPVLIVLGGVALFFAIKAVRFRIEADDQTGLSINGQAPIPWSSITDIDTSILSKKGYLFVKYRDPQDREVSLKLDEFNLDYFDELYAMIRSKLSLPADSPVESESSPTA
ncbi:MAG: hypothetical protein GWP14_04760 [Actinobacteria bacterium]|nr:hypothetical protein [Actinomycetota bacterium]